jgi:hypothetical protein
MHRTRRCAAYWKKKGSFAENPLGFGRFLDRIKTESFAIFGISNGVQKLGNWAGFFFRNSISSTKFCCKLLRLFEYNYLNGGIRKVGFSSLISNANFFLSAKQMHAMMMTSALFI